MSILVTGAAGQDGRLLTRALANKGKNVYGLCRPGRKEVLQNYSPNIKIIEVDVADQLKLVEVLNFIRPSEIYNLAGFSSVHQSWRHPALVTTINSVVPATILSWCLENDPAVKFLQASSSEIFGAITSSPQSEKTPLSPVTPYGLSKGYAHTLLQQYRNEYGLHASNAILYNHESPLRDIHFVTRKISRSVAAIGRGSKEPLKLGQIHSKRDWGWAPDYVSGMQSMMQKEVPGDYVFATGLVHTVEDLLRFAFNRIGIDDFSSYVQHDAKNDRHVDPVNLVGNNNRAIDELNWVPTTDLREIIETMVDFDIKLLDDPNSQWLAST